MGPTGAPQTCAILAPGANHRATQWFFAREAGSSAVLNIPTSDQGHREGHRPRSRELGPMCSDLQAVLGTLASVRSLPTDMAREGVEPPTRGFSVARSSFPSSPSQYLPVAYVPKGSRRNCRFPPESCWIPLTPVPKTAPPFPDSTGPDRCSRSDGRLFVPFVPRTIARRHGDVDRRTRAR